MASDERDRDLRIPPMGPLVSCMDPQYVVEHVASTDVLDSMSWASLDEDEEDLTVTEEEEDDDEDPFTLTDSEYNDPRRRTPQVTTAPNYVFELLASLEFHDSGSSAWLNEDEEDSTTTEEEVDWDEFILTDAEYEDYRRQTSRFTVPTYESFEGKLKNVMIDIEEEESTCCTICLEDICAGSNAASMPCSHVYHEDCIRKWLVNKRSCPLCRFEFPQREK